MKSVIFFFAFLVMAVAKGQDTTNHLIDLGDNGSGFILKLDPSTIKVEDKDNQIYSVSVIGIIDTSQLELIRLKLAVQYKDDQLKQASKATLQYFVDCDKQKVALCKTTYSDSSGNDLHSISYCEYGKTFEKAKSGSMRKDIADYVCSHKPH